MDWWIDGLLGMMELWNVVERSEIPRSGRIMEWWNDVAGNRELEARSQKQDVRDKRRETRL